MTISEALAVLKSQTDEAIAELARRRRAIQKVGNGEPLTREDYSRLPASLREFVFNDMREEG